MNNKDYGNMVKTRNSYTTLTKINILPVLCHSSYPTLDIFCDLMCRAENYRAPNYSSRKAFIRKSDLKILVACSLTLNAYFIQNKKKDPEGNLSEAQMICENNGIKKYDMIPVSVISESLNEVNALYLTMLLSPSSTEKNSLTYKWMTPDEIMEKVKEGVWLPSQKNTIIYLLNSLLRLPEITMLHNTRNRIFW